VREASAAARWQAGCHCEMLLAAFNSSTAATGLRHSPPPVNSASHDHHAFSSIPATSVGWLTDMSFSGAAQSRLYDQGPAILIVSIASAPRCDVPDPFSLRLRN